MSTEETTSTQRPSHAPSQEIGGISLSLRIPLFWRDRPRLWFISFEAAAHGLKRNQALLAQMVIAQLEKQDVEQIADLLYNPPNQQQYDILKERLISVYEEREGRQFQASGMLSLGEESCSCSHLECIPTSDEKQKTT